MIQPGARAWGEDLVELEREIAFLQLKAARLAYDLAEDTPEGFSSMVDWLRFSCHLTSNEAADRLNVGKHMGEMAETVEAMCAGKLGYGHLKVMARTAEAVGQAFDEDKLLNLALENSPGKFHFKCLHFRHSVDAKGYNRDQENLHEARSLWLSTAEDGCLLLSGCLDPIGGAEVRNALEELAAPSGEQEERTREQRLADALVARCEINTNVQLQVTSSVETLLGLVGAPGAEQEFSLPISAKTVERWACDSSLSRVLLQDSVVIDAGRSRRVLSPAMRKALVARDGHCRWPGCERPASWCDGHHLVHWTRGGETDVGGMVLLCKRHHRLVHEGGWQLLKTDEGELVTVAPPTVFGRPRGPDQVN